VISTRCEFCLNQFKFDEVAIKSHQALGGNTTRH